MYECLPVPSRDPVQVGTDANAELLKDALRGAGVRLDHLRQVEGPSGTAIILLQPSGRRLATTCHCQFLQGIRSASGPHPACRYMHPQGRTASS